MKAGGYGSLRAQGRRSDKRAHPHSRGTFVRPSDASSCPSHKRGHRECRCANAPAALRVKIENTQVSHHRHAETSGIPCTMVLRLIRALLGVAGLLAAVV